LCFTYPRIYLELVAGAFCSPLVVSIPWLFVIVRCMCCSLYFWRRHMFWFLQTHFTNKALHP
jgi:hypothetical protein